MIGVWIFLLLSGAPLPVAADGPQVTNDTRSAAPPEQAPAAPEAPPASPETPAAPPPEAPPPGLPMTQAEVDAATAEAEPLDDPNVPPPGTGALAPDLDIIYRDPSNWLGIPPDKELLNFIRDPLKRLDERYGL